MNKIVIIVALFIGMLSPLMAQKKFVITLHMGKATLSNNNFYVAKVFDHRINQDNIGVIQKGMNNKKQLAVFSKPTPLHIQNALNWMLSPTSKDKTPIMVSIRKLFISERTTAWKELGKAEVSLEFLTPDSLS